MHSRQPAVRPKSTRRRERLGRKLRGTLRLPKSGEPGESSWGKCWWQGGLSQRALPPPRRDLPEAANPGVSLWAQGMQLRVARHTQRLEALVAFYRDGLGLTELGRFDDHDGYCGVFLEVSGTGTHLELTAGGVHGAPVAHPESLLVLYLGDEEAVLAVVARLGIDPVAPANPYWAEHGITFEDPDGFRVVLVPERWRA